MKKKKNSKKIQLVFPKIDKDTQQQIIPSQNDIMGGFVTSVDEIKNWFKSYDIDSIEVWISGVIQTGGILKLVVSASGSGGVLVVLKPKST